MRISIIIIVVTSKLIIAETLGLAATSKENQPQDLSWHPLLKIDTKYWIRSTEFGEKENWRNLLRPCSLFERVKIQEQSVISLGDSLDALQKASGAIESNIKELTLAENGMLLLEEDIPLDPIDIAFIAYLNQTHDCLDTSELNFQREDNDSLLFEFQPNSDELSWFNPENWLSEMSNGELNLWIPEAHQIPCSDDIVVFGSKAASNYWSIMESERSKTLSFKVNFKASSELMKEFSETNISVSSVHVSKLKIGEQTFNQREFEQLCSSDLYKDILFDFKDGVLKSEQDFAYPAHSLLFTDESSVQQIAGNGYCSDEAGCLCGNEEVKVMKIICSFNYPLELSELPCKDPVSSVGYCNKICATVISIYMDPYKFSERFIADVVIKAVISPEMPENYFIGSVFVSGRRVSQTRYEITLRPQHNPPYHYHNTRVRVQELAQIIYAKLNNEASKSFYGIKMITTKASSQWRMNNRYIVFWITYSVSTVIAFLILVYNESDEKLTKSSNSYRGSFGASVGIHWVVGKIENFLPVIRASRSDEEDSFVRFSDPDITTETDEGSLSEIPLIRLKPDKN